MKMNTHFSGLIATVFLLAAATGQGAVVNCTFSGQDRLVIDTNGDQAPNSGAGGGADGYWTVTYDDVARVLMVERLGGPYPATTNPPRRMLFRYGGGGGAATLEELVEHTVNSIRYVSPNICHRVNMIQAVLGSTGASAGYDQITASWLRDNPGGPPVNNCLAGNENALGGVTDFPALQWSAGDTAFTGQLVDSNGDGVYDRMQGTIHLNTAHPWFPDVLIDEAVQYTSANNVDYLVLPRVLRLYLSGSSGPQGPFSIFVPLNGAGDGLDLTCGGAPLIGVSGLNAAAVAAAAVDIPALDRWGLLILTLAILFTGIGLMRRSGIGDDLSRP